MRGSSSSCSNRPTWSHLLCWISKEIHFNWLSYILSSCSHPLLSSWSALICFIRVKRIRIKKLLLPVFWIHIQFLSLTTSLSLSTSIAQVLSLVIRLVTLSIIHILWWSWIHFRHFVSVFINLGRARWSYVSLFFGWRTSLLHGCKSLGATGACLSHRKTFILFIIGLSQLLCSYLLLVILKGVLLSLIRVNVKNISKPATIVPTTAQFTRGKRLFLQ